MSAQHSPGSTAFIPLAAKPAVPDPLDLSSLARAIQSGDLNELHKAMQLLQKDNLSIQNARWVNRISVGGDVRKS
ncbi:hypothetical protein BH11PSE11_BH11PSE11_22830 [soil metagenome]